MADASNQDPSRYDGPLKEGEGRPSISNYTGGFKFRVGDDVRINATSNQALRGPYTVSETFAGPRYTLEKSDGSLVDNGKKFDENELEHAN